MQDGMLSWTVAFRTQLFCVWGALFWRQGAQQGPLCYPWPSLQEMTLQGVPQDLFSAER